MDDQRGPSSADVKIYRQNNRDCVEKADADLQVQPILFSKERSPVYHFYLGQIIKPYGRINGEGCRGRGCRLHFKLVFIWKKRTVNTAALFFAHIKTRAETRRKVQTDGPSC